MSVVEGEGFREFCQALNPQYRVPSHTCVKNYLLATYDKEKDVLVGKLSKLDVPVALTTDIWTSCATQAYLTATCHFIDDNWEMNNVVLATRKLESNHTGSNISEELKNIQSEFKIKDVSAIVTDNASNMVCAASISHYDHVQCFAHTLQLAVHDALNVPNVVRVLGICRKLTAFFHKSVVANDALEKHQRLLGKQPKRVISDVATRWNSAYFMMQRLLELRSEIYAVLHDSTLTSIKKALNKGTIIELKTEQWTVIEHLTKVLKPLVSATEVLCAEEYPTCVAIFPLTFGLLNNHLQAKDVDIGIVATVKEKIRNGLRQREMKGEYWLTLPMIASVFHPSYKRLKFLSEEQRHQVYAEIRKEMEQIRQDHSDTKSVDPQGEYSTT